MATGIHSLSLSTVAPPPREEIGLLEYTLSQHSGSSSQRGNRYTGIHSLSGVDPPPREEIGLLEYTLSLSTVDPPPREEIGLLEYTLSVEWTLLPERK